VLLLPARRDHMDATATELARRKRLSVKEYFTVEQTKKAVGRRRKILRHEVWVRLLPQRRHIKVRARTSQHHCTCHSGEVK
jgi:hypothetical protein